jgi:nitroreductase
MEIIRIGTSAPSAGNMQPWRIVIVKDSKNRERLARAALNQEFVAAAPVVLVICAVPRESAIRYGERGARLYSIQDTAALTENILLAALFKGYSTCWVGAFDDQAVAAAVNVPKNIRPVALVPMGKAVNLKPSKPRRRSLSDIVIYERFS